MIAALLEQITKAAASVALAVTPLVLCFLLFQVFFLQLPRMEVVRVLRGTFIAATGLGLFLLGVSIGFLPFGRAIGEALARFEGGTGTAMLCVSSEGSRIARVCRRATRKLVG